MLTKHVLIVRHVLMIRLVKNACTARRKNHSKIHLNSAEIYRPILEVEGIAFFSYCNSNSANRANLLSKSWISSPIFISTGAWDTRRGFEIHRTLDTSGLNLICSYTQVSCGIHRACYKVATHSELELSAHNFLNTQVESTMMQRKLLSCDILRVLHRGLCLAVRLDKVPLMSCLFLILIYGIHY